MKSKGGISNVETQASFMDPINGDSMMPFELMEETGILDSYEEYVTDLNAQINNLKSKIETMQTQIEINDSNFKT